VDELFACSGCGRWVAPRQDYCLECGTRVVRPQGLVPALGRRWRRALPGYPGDWIWPSLAALAIAAAGAAAAIDATGGTAASAPRPLVLTSALAAPSTTVASGPRTRRVIAWPLESGWTVVLATFPVADGGGAARDRAARALGAGLSQVGILLSSNFASLHPGYYVVFTGVYGSRDDAEAALPTAARRFPNAAVQPVVR
jgi:hypothetical protein